MDATAEDSAETRRLLDCAAAGEPAAFDRLFARHRPAIVQFLRNRFDPRLRARTDPSDVAQEAQMEAYRRLGDYLARRPMPFRVWLHKTAYERLRMAERRHLGAGRRAARRETTLPDASSEALVRKLVGPDLPPDEAADLAERTLRVRQALAGLSADDREVLLMRSYEALPYAEIAALLDVSEQTARQRHGRALARLSRLLTEAGDVESGG